MKNKDKNKLEQLQQKARDEIENDEKLKLDAIERAKKSIEEQRQDRIKKITTPLNQSNQQQTIDARMRCPVCGSTSIAKISKTSRIVSTAMVGIASSKIGKQWHCNSCKTDF
ncbi:MAG: hypothetical protein ACOYBE_12705 [Blautia sp.]